MFEELQLKSIDNLPNFKANTDGTVSVTKAFSFGGRTKRKREDYHPTVEELVDIHSTSLIDYEPSDIYVFTMLAADMQDDRQYEHFLPKGLAELAVALKKKTWLEDPHEWKTKNEVGRILDAWVEDGKLYLKTYILNSSENQKFINNIFAGIHSGVSVGFTSKYEDMLCDSCAKAGRKTSIYDKNICYHQPGTYDEFGQLTKVSIDGVLDGFEISNAPVQAQRAASILAKSMGAADVQDAIDAQSVDTDLVNNSIKEEKDIMETLKAVAQTEVEITKAENMEEEKAVTESVDSSASPVVEEQLTVIEESEKGCDPKMEDEEMEEEEEVEKTTEILQEASRIKEASTEKSSDETSFESNSDSPDTIKSDSSIIQDNSTMSQKEAQDIEHNPVADKELPLWVTELKSAVSSLNETLAAIKGTMDEMVSSVNESKDMLTRYTTPKDGSDSEWEVHAVKQAEQAQVLEGLVEKTVKVLESLTAQPEQKPSQNEWARKLANKLASGGKN